MKKTIVIAVTCLISIAASIYAQTTYYYQLAKNKSDGHFITITSQSCYDSDANGVSLGNGTRSYTGKENGCVVFYGPSVFGFASYFFSNNYNNLKIVGDNGHIYQYVRVTPPRGAVSAHGSACSHDHDHGGYVAPMIQPIQSTSGTSNSSPSQTTITTTCPSCNGTGYCTMCKGRGIYQNTYDGKWYNCPSCGGTGRCKVCHGAGKIK